MSAKDIYENRKGEFVYAYEGRYGRLVGYKGVWLIVNVPGKFGWTLRHDCDYIDDSIVRYDKFMYIHPSTI